MNSSHHYTGRSVDRLITEIEDALLSASDEAVLATPGMAGLAAEAKQVVEAARGMSVRLVAAATRPPRRRAAARPLPVSPGRRRALVQRLLVADSRARDIVGKTAVEAMTDAEIEAVMTRFAAVGLVPEAE